MKVRTLAPASLLVAGLALVAFALSVSGVYVKNWHVDVASNSIVFTVCGQVCLTQQDVADGCDGQGLAKCDYVDIDPVFNDTLFTSTTWEHTIDLTDLVAALQADPNLPIACKEVCVTDVRSWSSFQSASGEGTPADPIELQVTLDVYVPPHSASGTSGTTNVWN